MLSVVLVDVVTPEVGGLTSGCIVRVSDSWWRDGRWFGLRLRGGRGIGCGGRIGPINLIAVSIFTHFD